MRMPDARGTFYERIEALGSAISHDSVVSGPPAARMENARARIMRSGLAVTTFTILEDFLRARTQETFAYISRSGNPFGKMPAQLRRIATIRTVKAILFQLGIKNDARDDIAYVQEKASSIASTLTASYEISDIAFGYDTSNLSDTMVEELLEALHIDKPWESMGQIGARAGIGTLRQRHRAAFLELAARRHHAAHDPRSDVQPSELEAGLLDVVGLAIGFDGLISMAGERFRTRDQNFLSGKKKITQKELGLIFVEPIGAEIFGVKREDAKKYWRKKDSIEGAIDHARRLCHNQQAIVVTVNNRKVPVRWESPSFAG